MIFLRQARRHLIANASRFSKSSNAVVLNRSALKALSSRGARSLSTTVASPENCETSMDWMKILAGAAAAGTIASGIINDKKAECCGIAGVVGTGNNDAR
jgi:UDP-N-acetylglucosamine:LPS N-acetylglucosamine transferase